MSKFELTSPLSKMNRESLVIPSFADLYEFRSDKESPVMIDWLNKELRLILVNKGIREEQHKAIQALWADRSRPDRLIDVQNHFKAVSESVESAHAEAYVHMRRLVHGSETFRDVQIMYCDQYNGGDWYDRNYWHLVNDATHGAGDAEKAAMDAAGDELWTTPLPLMTYPINPICPWPVGACEHGKIRAAQLLEEFMHYNIHGDVCRLSYEIKRLIKYVH